MGDLDRRRLWTSARLLTVAAVCSFMALAGAPAAMAEGNPPGANGTIKIDGPAYDPGVDTDPHVTCEFDVKLFNFDKGQRGDLTFFAHPPTAADVQIAQRTDVLLSPDNASGAANDPDEVYHFTLADMHLSGYTPQAEQGYHIKLKVTFPNSGDKQKVFWVRPCQSNGGGNNGGGNNGGSNGSGNNAGGAGGQGLPITGYETAGIALAGVALVGGGVAMVLIRRRRRVTFTA